ncbi:MAG TPA: peptidylprolyl isomerase [Steroidobacteraceae bacterium]|nr:peptidylprolyl isomerase [Steroidobacteraceae bacterium]
MKVIRDSTARWLALCVLFSQLAVAQDPVATPQQASAPAPESAPSLVDVVLHTTLGDIRFALEKDRAPISTANFLRYVDQKRLDNTTFYRAVKISEDGKYGLLQGGLKGNPKLAFKPIAHEPTSATGLSHLDGAISMARTNPGTATADFFIVIGDLTSLDAKADGSDPGYAMFGRVTSGMDLVHQMLELPRSAEAGDGSMKGQMLAEPVKILTVRRAP